MLSTRLTEREGQEVALPEREYSRPAAVVTWGGTAALIVATAALVASGMRRKAAAPSPVGKKLTNVEVVCLEAREYRESLVLPARIVADRRGNVASEYPGRLLEWLVAEGAEVAERQPVAILDTAELHAQLTEAMARETSAGHAVTVAERQLRSAQVGLDKAKGDLAALDLELQSAVADRELAEREHARMKSLTDSGIGTGSDLDSASNRFTQAELGEKRVQDAMARAKIEVESARAMVAESEAAQALATSRTAEASASVAALNIRLEQATLRSPLSGRIDEHLLEPGEYVAPGVPVGRVFDLSHIRATVDVADRYVPFLDAANPALAEYVALAMPGARSDIRTRLVLPGLPKLTGGTHAGLDLDAKIVRISQAADPASNTFRVELRLPNPGAALKEGLIARAHIDYLVYPEAIVIPLKAIQVADVGPRVLVVEEHSERRPDGDEPSHIYKVSRAKVRDIEPLSIRGDEVLVGRGLAAGDRLVVQGGKGIIDGEEVNVLVADGVLQSATLPGSDGHGGRDTDSENIRVPPDYRPREPDAGGDE